MDKGNLIIEDKYRRMTGYWFLDTKDNRLETMTHIIVNGRPICSADIFPEWKLEIVAVVPSLQLNACKGCRTAQISFLNKYGNRLPENTELKLRLGM